MNPKFGREIALLSLPVMLFGGAALWNSKLKGHFKIKSWSGFGAPRGLYEGKPRLEIAKWEKVEPTALDFGRGISSRWKVTTWHGGACPGGKPPSVSGVMMAPVDLYFEWKRAGRSTKTPVNLKNSELEFQFLQQRQRPSKYEIQLGLPLDLVPADADEVRLKGHLKGLLGCGNLSVAAPSAPLDQLLKASGEAWPRFLGTKISPLTFKGDEQLWCLPDPKEDPKGDRLQIEAKYFASNSNVWWNIEEKNSRVVDAQGHRVAPAEWTNSGSDANGDRSMKWRIDTRQLRGRRGPFLLKSWIYTGKSEWPMPVSIPIKPPKRL